MASSYCTENVDLKKGEQICDSCHLLTSTLRPHLHYTWEAGLRQADTPQLAEARICRLPF
jgi:hypothetical protein